jgi:hypothetical protein
MLKRVFEDVAPYISNLSEIKKFVDENEGKGKDEILRILEEKIATTTGTLKTDYKILLNEFEKTINNRM